MTSSLVQEVNIGTSMRIDRRIHKMPFFIVGVPPKKTDIYT